MNDTISEREKKILDFANRLVIGLNRTFRCTICVLLCLCCGGCPKPTVTQSGATAKQVSSVARQQSNEVFKQTITTLNTLEEHPCLVGHRESEILNQIVSRLDKWIRYQSSDPLWRKDVLFEEMETPLRSVVTKIQKSAAFLQRLQGNTVSADDKTLQGDILSALPTFLTDTEKTMPLSEVRRQLGPLFAEIDTDLLRLEPIVRVPFHQVAPPFAQMARQFSSLDNMGDIPDEDVQAFSLQIPLLPLAQFALGTTWYGDSLKVEPLDFQVADGNYLKQCVWVRNVSNWARGDKQDDLSRATELFDWVVRNIDLRSDRMVIGEQRQPDGTIRREYVHSPRQRPWQTLLFGHGSQWDRAWLFIELLRQQRLDAGVLAVRPAANPTTNSVVNLAANPQDGEPIPWAVGVLIEGEIYIFLPGLGVPLPGKDGIALIEGVGLTFPNIATLKEVATNPELLEKFEAIRAVVPFDPTDVPPQTVQLLSTPGSAAQRMCILEKELLGQEQKMVLYVSYTDQAKRFAETAHVQTVTHWDRPFESEFEAMVNPMLFTGHYEPFLLPSRDSVEVFPLWTGRVLHLKGKKSGEDTAITQYRDVRIPERVLQQLRMAPELVGLLRFAKLNAGYWSAIIAFEDGNMTLAKDGFGDRSMLAGIGSPWLGGIQYNLGRIEERLGNYTEASSQYRKFPTTPAATANVLRAAMIDRVELETSKQ